MHNCGWDGDSTFASPHGTSLIHVRGVRGVTSFFKARDGAPLLYHRSSSVRLGQIGLKHLPIEVLIAHLTSTTTTVPLLPLLDLLLQTVILNS